MADKKPPSVLNRRNLYWSGEMEDMVIAIADKLHKQGVKGLYSSKGEVNRTAVVRYLMTKELSKNH